MLPTPNLKFEIVTLPESGELMREWEKFKESLQLTGVLVASGGLFVMILQRKVALEDRLTSQLPLPMLTPSALLFISLTFTLATAPANVDVMTTRRFALAIVHAWLCIEGEGS